MYLSQVHRFSILHNGEIYATDNYYFWRYVAPSGNVRIVYSGDKSDPEPLAFGAYYRPGDMEEVGSISASRLKKERGWTDKMIQELLPSVPKSEMGANYGYVLAAYYDLDTIRIAETLPEFCAWLDKLEKKRKPKRDQREEEHHERWCRWQERIKKGIEENADLISRASLVEPSALPDLEDYPDWMSSRSIVNDIRHNYSNYEELIDNCPDTSVGNAVYVRIRNRVLDLIAEEYPELYGECQNQKGFDTLKTQYTPPCIPIIVKNYKIKPPVTDRGL